MTVQSHLSRLLEVSQELRSLHRELATVLNAEHRAKLLMWEQTDGSLQERSKFADLAAMDLTEDVFKIKGEIQALQEEKDFLRLLIHLETEYGIAGP